MQADLSNQSEGRVLVAENKEETCSICCDQKVNYMLPCKHWFHGECLAQWVDVEQKSDANQSEDGEQKIATCPNCRKEHPNLTKQSICTQLINEGIAIKCVQCFEEKSSYLLLDCGHRVHKECFLQAAIINIAKKEDPGCLLCNAKQPYYTKSILSSSEKALYFSRLFLKGIHRGFLVTPMGLLLSTLEELNEQELSIHRFIYLQYISKLSTTGIFFKDSPVLWLLMVCAINYKAIKPALMLQAQCSARITLAKLIEKLSYPISNMLLPEKLSFNYTSYKCAFLGRVIADLLYAQKRKTELLEKIAQLRKTIESLHPNCVVTVEIDNGESRTMLEPEANTFLQEQIVENYYLLGYSDDLEKTAQRDILPEYYRTFKKYIPEIIATGAGAYVGYHYLRPAFNNFFNATISKVGRLILSQTTG